MSKSIVVHPFTLCLVFTVIIVLAMPAFADEIPLQPEFDAAVGSVGPSGSGFGFNFGRNHNFVIRGFGTSTLPVCPTPCMSGTIFNPSVVLSGMTGGGFIDIGLKTIQYPWLFFQGSITVEGNSFKIPSGPNPDLARHVTFNGQLLACTTPSCDGSVAFVVNVHRGATLHLRFSGSGSDLRLVSETYSLAPEPGTLALLVTGIGLIGGLGFRRISAHQGCVRNAE